jgi:electron transport complex protein RnfD
MTDTPEIRLPDTSKLVVSSSPHLHDSSSVRMIMLTVILALLPACAMGVFYFGWRALYVISVCGVGCVAVEHVCCKISGKPTTIGDLSALLTGILLAMNLSASTPWWVCIIGAILAIGLAKHLYGGLGYNPFNPALVARVGLLIALPKFLTGQAWVQPQAGRIMQTAQAVTTATPLDDWKTNANVGTEYWNYFLGNMPGCIGETSAIALIVGGLVLIYLGLIRWQVPLGFIGSVAIITWIFGMTSAGPQPTPLFHLLTGGLMLGAFFMATDMVTSPITKSGALIFGIGCGVVTAVIRLFGSYPEGVSFSILFMNALTPLIDRYTPKKAFGESTSSKG